MKNKGFTLIELIGTIVIISLMALIIIPTADKVIKHGIALADKQTIENIILAAKNWATDHKDQLPVYRGDLKDLSLVELKTVVISIKI